MIGIIDYKAGNAPSVLSAVKSIGHKAEFISCAADMVGKTHIILPGVGSAGATMTSLDEMGLITPLKKAIADGVMFLGVCVGMQVLFEHSEEDDADCLGLLEGEVVRFDVNKVRVPQMGWNQVEFEKNCLNEQSDYFYFVNSYFAKPKNKDDIWGVSDYNGTFTAAVNKGNIFGTQYHIEKSGKAGLALLDKFLSTKGGTAYAD